MSQRMFLHESLYRGEDSVRRLGEFRLTLCGAGAVGSLLADNLVRQGMRQIKVIDCDRIEEHNVSTQLYDAADAGAWKAEVLRNRLFRACQAEIEAVTKRLEEKNARKMLGNCDLIVDAFDNSLSRGLIQRQCRAQNIPCLHVGLFEDYCESIWDETYRVPADAEGDICEYPLARNLVLLAVSLASETVIRFLLEGKRHSHTATLGDFTVREFEGLS